MVTLPLYLKNGDQHHGTAAQEKRARLEAAAKESEARLLRTALESDVYNETLQRARDREAALQRRLQACVCVCVCARARACVGVGVGVRAWARAPA